MASREEQIEQLDVILAGLNKAEEGIGDALDAVDHYQLPPGSGLSRYIELQASDTDAYIGNARRYIQNARTATEKEKRRLQQDQDS